MKNFLGDENFAGAGFGRLPFPAVGGGTSNTGFPLGADIIGLRKTHINYLNLCRLTVGEVVNFVRDGDIVVGLVEFIENPQHRLKPFRRGDGGFGRVGRDALMQRLKLGLNRLRQLFINPPYVRFYARDRLGQLRARRF